MALLLGGLLPALMFGIGGLIQKLGARGIATGPFLATVGATVLAVGLGYTALERDASASRAGLGWSVLYGFCWALAVGGINIALRRFGGQVSVLVPIFNTNTLVAVALGLAVLGEWRTVNLPRILIASALIIVGGILASKA